VLGILDGLTAWFTPEVRRRSSYRDRLHGQGLVAGAIIGFFARK